MPDQQAVLLGLDFLFDRTRAANLSGRGVGGKHAHASAHGLVEVGLVDLKEVPEASELARAWVRRIHPVGGCHEEVTPVKQVVCAGGSGGRLRLDLRPGPSAVIRRK